MLYLMESTEYLMQLHKSLTGGYIILTSSPMEMLEHFLPFSPVSLTPFLQWEM